MYFKQININSTARHMSVSNTFYSLCILCMHDFPVCVFNPAFRGCQNPINGLCELYKSLKHYKKTSAKPETKFHMTKSLITVLLACT